jgi:hypothetical protein
MGDIMTNLASLAPVAVDGSPAHAFASHKARANGMARFFAEARPLSEVNGKASENNSVAVLAHLHAASADPAFSVNGEEVSRTAAVKAIMRLNKGDGEVGTHKDYDMALKGLMTVLYRYRPLLGAEGVSHILSNLVPSAIRGGHSEDLEVIVDIPVIVEYPETENHLLMIETTRYLVNQLLFDQTGDRAFNNSDNGLAGWLLLYLQRFSKHDFLEFNSRPYQRLALHPILNLYEFARDPSLRLAAQQVLDYVMMKFAVSSNRVRRISPFRRLQHRIDHQANERNFHFAGSGDQVAQMFAAYTGYIDVNGSPAPHPPALVDIAGVVAATSAYRPPPAVYAVAMGRNVPAAMHRFYHGVRPQLPAAGEDAEGGVELYYRSPSFLISAGGTFLNSGYGRDEFDTFKEAWEQTSRAQATTLIPTRADTLFHDLVRFEPVPDPLKDPYSDDREDPDTLRATAVNTAVHRGLMAGANLRPGYRKTVLENSTSLAPCLTTHNGVLKICWRGSGNENISVANVQVTTLMGMAGVEGIDWKVISPATTDRPPAIASHNGRLYLAWKGSGNDNLNLAFFDEPTRAFVGTHTLNEHSPHQPALASHNGRLYLSWTGTSNEKINVAKVLLIGNTQGGFQIGGLENKNVTTLTSSTGPALASHGGKLFLAWKGSGNDNLNLALSADDGGSFVGTRTFPDTSSHSPAIASHEGRLFYAWKGSGNEQLNVARVILIGNTSGASGIESLENKVVLTDFSTQPPALGSHLGQLFVAWKGEGDDNLNIRLSRDGTFSKPGPWEFVNLQHFGFYLAVYRTPPGRTDDLDAVPDDFAIVYAMEATVMPFEAFVSETMARNTQLPQKLDHDGRYQFHAPDGRRFAVWINLTADKYRERIAEEGAAIGNFRSLPLVRGEYLTAPNGHDGLLEIRDPDNPGAPLLLDHRDAARPVRNDTKTSSPRPWLERTSALFVLADRLAEQGRHHDAVTARADAVDLYDELVRAAPSTSGPALAPSVISALALKGIDFSVPAGDLREWLSNPEFTPYPALASTLLRRAPLKAPVFIDVIAFKYETTPGAASPRQPADVRADILDAATVAAFNERHGTAHTAMQELVVTA